MARGTRPLVFGIGLPHSGGRVLSALFADNGLGWRHHMGGKLAQSIAYAQATETRALQKWRGAAGFSGLYHIHKRHLPPLRVQDFVAPLYAQFPDAYYILTHRDPADWIAARFWQDGPDHRAAEAWHAKIEEADLPAFWLDEQSAYTAQCREIFAECDRFINFNVTKEPVDMVIDFLSKDFDLTPSRAAYDLGVSAADIDAVAEFVENAAPKPNIAPPDMNFARQVADFCEQKKDPSGNLKALSGSAVIWQDINTFKDRLGADVAMVGTPKVGTLMLHPDSAGFERAQGTILDLVAHGAKPPLNIDMMDARFIGTKGRRIPPPKTVAYNRRGGAVNLTLWPLPGYHTLAPTGTAGGFTRDVLPFADKEDRCVWLGNMTGRMSPVLTPEGRDLRGVYQIRDRALGPAPNWDDISADLDCVPRYNIVKTYRDHPDFEVALVLRAKWKELVNTPPFKGLCTAKRPREFLHKYRYILSLAGNDTGSNFLMAAACNALILKEEDGWELFYTDAFKPWVHYVPLDEGAQDVEEKLAWARANPDKAEAMSVAATELFDKFANPNNRAAILSAVAARLNED